MINCSIIDPEWLIDIAPNFYVKSDINSVKKNNM